MRSLDIGGFCHHAPIAARRSQFVQDASGAPEKALTPALAESCYSCPEACHASINSRADAVRPEHRGTSIVERATTGLPPDLLNRAATRLQTLAWLYAFTFFMAAFFPRLLFPDERRILFEHAMSWAPGVISIAVAVSVALAIRTAQLRPAAVTVLALVFEVVSSYGIAAAEFLAAQLDSTSARAGSVCPGSQCGCCCSTWSSRRCLATP